MSLLPISAVTEHRNPGIVGHSRPAEVAAAEAVFAWFRFRTQPAALHGGALHKKGVHLANLIDREVRECWMWRGV